MTDTEDETQTYVEDDDFDDASDQGDSDYEPEADPDEATTFVYTVPRSAKKRRVDSIDTQGTSSQCTIDDDLPPDQEIATQVELSLCDKEKPKRKKQPTTRQGRKAKARPALACVRMPPKEEAVLIEGAKNLLDPRYHPYFNNLEIWRENNDLYIWCKYCSDTGPDFDANSELNKVLGRYKIRPVGNKETNIALHFFRYCRVTRNFRNDISEVDSRVCGPEQSQQVRNYFTKERIENWVRHTIKKHLKLNFSLVKKVFYSAAKARFAELLSECDLQECELKDGHYFMRLLNEEKSRILKNAADLEKEFEALQAASSVTLSEEIIGVVRAVIEESRCLANLKFKIFENLCNVPATVSGDLQGFWDMMLLQIENINQSFSEIQKCRENGWKKPEASTPQPPKANRITKRPLTQSQTAKAKTINPVKKPSTAPGNSKAAQRREEQRKKSLEMKRKQKAAIPNGADENSCLNGDSEAVGDTPVNGDAKQ